jgi:hypothetical protein
MKYKNSLTVSLISGFKTLYVTLYSIGNYFDEIGFAKEVLVASFNALIICLFVNFYVDKDIQVLRIF